MTHPIAHPSKKAFIMALIICPECDGTVSDKASTCVRCEYPLHGESAVQATCTDSDTQSQHFCTALGAALPHGVRFCTSCGASWNPGSFRRIPALANPPSSCPAASARVAHAARAKAKRARGPQMPKMRIHACHHRRAGLFDYLGFHGRRQHRKPLRQMRL